MAFIQMNLFSDKLVRTVPVYVILPADKAVIPGMPKRPDKPFKTLYLLHGILGSHVDWTLNTRIQRFAEEHDLAVVMPAGENAFYVDQPKSHNLYGEFVGEELVELTRKIFPLSHKREDTFIGGLSMGGFGAMRNGLKYSDTFGYIVSLSGAYVVEGFPERDNSSPMFMETRDYAEAFFGDLDKVLESDKNPRWLIKKLKEEGKDIPKIFMACGQEDSLLGANESLRDYLIENDVPVDYFTGPGNHEWDFWETYIKKAIYEWLPTEKSEAGFNSGNIGL
ncbi:MAG: alpha/beta hydrolase family protein [Eubacteriales bacterium]|nr:alpha/beta hydrolase family protein [Eubacteriales bacterium]